MNASPLLSTLLIALRKERLEVVLIGNAAAALHGAPVTTLDFDFMFRDTVGNLQKLKRVSADLEATILRPFYPVSKWYRMVDDATGLQADFMPGRNCIGWPVAGSDARQSPATLSGSPGRQHTRPGTQET